MSYARQLAVSAPEDPDHALVLKTRQGDTAAFAELVEKYKQPIISFASRTLRDRTEAEDIAQNVFFQAFRESGQFRFAARFSTWLYAIARNLCRNELRRRSRHSMHALGTWGEAAQAGRWRFLHPNQLTPRESLVDQELHERIEQALSALPEPQRLALLLLREGDITYQEIALALGHSLSATKTLIYRGRRTLKRNLDRHLTRLAPSTRGRPKHRPAKRLVVTALAVELE